MNTKRVLLGLILCALFIMGNSRSAATGSSADWHVLGGGGGRVSNGSLVLEGTAGQAVSGSVEKATVQLCAGFWCGSEGIFEYPWKTHLPIIYH